MKRKLFLNWKNETKEEKDEGKDVMKLEERRQKRKPNEVFHNETSKEF